MISHLLQAEGVICETASSGQEAITKIFTRDSSSSAGEVSRFSLDGPVDDKGKGEETRDEPTPLSPRSAASTPTSPLNVNKIMPKYHLILSDIHMPVSLLSKFTRNTENYLGYGWFYYGKDYP